MNTEQMMEQIFNKMSWGQPELVQGRALVKAKPSPAFWDLWRQDKPAIKRAGIFITKEDGKFIAQRWVPMDVVYTGNKQPRVRSRRKLKFGAKLLEYQRPHGLKLLNALLRFGAALDGSDTGTGKTFTALTTAQELGLIPFVVCPKNSIYSWKRWANYLGVKEIVALNYERLKTGKTEYLAGKDMKWLIDRERYLVIFDEVHRCKSYKSINHMMLVAAKEQGYRVMGLSATVADNPLQLKAVGFMLGLFPRPNDFWSWIKTHGCYKNRYDALEFSGNRLILQRIHGYIYPERGSRMRISELGDAFPDNKVVAESYSMDSASKIQKVYKEMKKQLAELAFKSKLDGESELTIILRARQKVELLKVPTFVEMAKDLLDEGHAVVIFVNFTETLLALSEKLKTKCLVYGKQSGAKGAATRQKNIDIFVADEEQLIICNIKAGGEAISLHDLHGKHRRVSLVSPTWSAQELVQALGRIHRAGAQSKAVQRIIFAAGTVEEDIAEAVAEKIDRIKTLNDGDLTKGLQISLSEE